MELEYSLNEEDYLTQQLYSASKSDRVKKQRFKSRLLVALIFISLSYLFYAKEDNFLMYYFAGFSILTFIFYPYYQKKALLQTLSKVYNRNL
ncbi:hypothetical protein [Flavobacterium capsici]|uniref:Uncharacterized protein n=1 Tax=Flavobacterium capsici TaxID=3075618 RepID=A0AA96EZ75_9FLAO|nr:MULTISPECIES: hypothetical protein [unclassified Flavobacterium]WNM18170.1 hypothetical protein RN608_09105 [Flavobacterium sp. PMR2A8]WNM22222.1 hypothetical protein RN605_02405 [Flavobacterium sp. PMTSA4]